MNWADILLEEEKEEDPLKDYALFIDAGRHSSDFILYKPKYYANSMKREIAKAKQKFDKIRFKGERFNKFKDFYAFSNVKDIFRDPKGVYGFMSINDGRIIGMPGTCNRANEIRAIAAKEGFGKLMFMIALAKESPIMPNREEVSDIAYDHWKKLNSDTRLEKDKFDNELRLAKKDTEDCKVFGDRILDQSYSTKGDVSIELQPLTNRHKIFLNQMKNYFENVGVDYIQSRVKEYISNAGTQFFDRNKGESGWYENPEEFE